MYCVNARKFKRTSTNYDNVIVIDGTVCGINIKPMDTFNIGFNKEAEYRIEKKMAIYLHVRLCIGDQYDLIFPMVPSNILIQDGVNNALVKVPYQKKKKYFKDDDVEGSAKRWNLSRGRYVNPVDEVLYACGVDEWVNIIGSNVKIVEQMRSHGEQKAIFIYADNDDLYTEPYECIPLYPDEFSREGVLSSYCELHHYDNSMREMESYDPEKLRQAIVDGKAMFMSDLISKGRDELCKNNKCYNNIRNSCPWDLLYNTNDIRV
jgi:hypothetical protein